MKFLVPLVELLSHYRLKKIDILANEESDSSYTRLFRQIAQGQIRTDEEASRYLFGAAPSSLRFRKFKSVFRRKLLDNVFFLTGEQEHVYPLQKAYLNIQKEWAAIQILQTLGQLRLAAQLAEKILSKAIHYEITEITVFLLSILKHEAAHVRGDDLLYEEYLALHAHYLETYRLEQQALTCYEKIRIHFAKSLAPKPELADEAASYCTALVPYLDKYPAHRLHLYVKSIEIFEALIRCDYHKVLEVTQRSILFFLQKPFLHHRALALFYNRLVL